MVTAKKSNIIYRPKLKVVIVLGITSARQCKLLRKDFTPMRIHEKTTHQLVVKLHFPHIFRNLEIRLGNNDLVLITVLNFKNQI